MKRYRISPSLLQGFSRWLDAGDTWQRLWGNSAEPSKTCEEYEEECRKELLAYLNREPQEPSEAADRGTCLNEVIDRLNGATPIGEVQIEDDVQGGVYVCKLHGFTFRFDRAFVQSLALMFKTAVAQAHLESTYTVMGMDAHGDDEPAEVVLHGYADYVFPTMIWDLKTTNRYECEKYAGGWQRHVYPVAAMDAGLMLECESFTYYALEMRETDGVLFGKPFTETYDVNVDESRAKILEFITNLVLQNLEAWAAQGLIPNNNVITEC